MIDYPEDRSITAEADRHESPSRSSSAKIMYPGQFCLRMRPGRLGVALVLLAFWLPLVCSQAAAAGRVRQRVISPLPASDYAMRRACGAPTLGHAACMAVKLVPQTTSARARDHPIGRPVSVPASESSACEGGKPAAEGCDGLTPQDIHSAYELPSEVSPQQTIALVDAYNDPSAEADLEVYDKEFGLPACTSGNGCFTQVNQEGKTSPLPETEGGWSVEISLDIEVAHATCESCRIVLVEAKTSSYENLETAEATAAGKLAANEISNSWAGEEPVETGSKEESEQVSAALKAFDYPGTVITAAAGDDGYLNWFSSETSARGLVSYPASSPDVVAVGGTRLSLTAEGAWESETVWNGAYVGEDGDGSGGSGCSAHFDAPSWQTKLVANWESVGCGEKRAVADVAADADPYTGLAVYDSTPESDHKAAPGWEAIGGTSLATPLIAATFALAGGANGVEFPAETLYANETADTSSLHDVETGSNGECKKKNKEDGVSGCYAEEAAKSCSEKAICLAGKGYDGPTGLGTPDGLAAFEPAGNPAKKTQSISFTSTAPGNAMVGEDSYVVTAEASSTLAVELISENASICTLSSDASGATVEMKAAGTCVIVAGQAGDGEYEAAPEKKQEFVVYKKTQSISFSSAAPSNATVGEDSYEVKAGASSGLSVTLSSEDTSVCALSGSASGATVEMKAAGTCVIVASQAGDGEYEAAPVAWQSFQVAKASQQITFSSSAPGDPTVGGAVYEVTATASSGLPVAFSSATPVVCAVDESTVSFVGAGSCTIEATQAGNADYEAAPPVQRSFQVAKASQTVAFTSQTPATATIGGTDTVSASASSGLPVSFASASPAVCTVEGSTVSFVAAGTCTIDASQTGDSDYEAATEAQQSFAIDAVQPLLSTPLGSTSPLSPTSSSSPASSGVSGSTSSEASGSTSTPATSGFALLGVSVDRKTGAVKLTASLTGAGRLTWLLSFKRPTASARFTAAKSSSVEVVFGKGSAAVGEPRTLVVTVRPTAAALRELERLSEQNRGLRVQALLSFHSSEGGSPVERKRSTTVRLTQSKDFP